LLFVVAIVVVAVVVGVVVVAVVVGVVAVVLTVRGTAVAASKARERLPLYSSVSRKETEREKKRETERERKKERGREREHMREKKKRERKRERERACVRRVGASPLSLPLSFFSFLVSPSLISLPLISLSLPHPLFLP